MIAAPCDTEILPLAQDSCSDTDDGLYAAALRVLQSSSYAALRQLRCEVTEAVIIIHGVLPSYYLKQVAQALILRLDGVRSVTNLVEVRASNPFQPAAPDEY
jgi:hypothetical protein